MTNLLCSYHFIKATWTTSYSLLCWSLVISRYRWLSCSSMPCSFMSKKISMVSDQVSIIWQILMSVRAYFLSNFQLSSLQRCAELYTLQFWTFLSQPPTVLMFLSRCNKLKQLLSLGGWEGGHSHMKGQWCSLSRSGCKFLILVSLRLFWAKRHYIQLGKSCWELYAKKFIFNSYNLFYLLNSYKIF